MVIIVFGIVASISSDIFSNLYSNYVKTSAANKNLTLEELVLDQIEKRLTFRIKDSVILREYNATSVSNNFKSISQMASGDTQTVLEWIGYSYESFLGTPKPSWNGFIDLDSNHTDRNASGISLLKTPDSNLTFASALIENLTYDDVSLTDLTKNAPAIIFKMNRYDFNVTNYGWNGTKGEYTLRVRANSADTLELIDANATFPENISEQYFLVHSAYAIVPEGSSNDFNLSFYYNYQPWENENYMDGDKTVLAEHVRIFTAYQQGENYIRLKIKITDANNSGDYDFGSAIERFVF